MFGIGKRSSEEPPKPPTPEEILEDLEKALPDDIVFTANIAQLNADIGAEIPLSRSFKLTNRFQVILFLSSLLYFIQFFIFHFIQVYSILFKFIPL